MHEKTVWDLWLSSEKRERAKFEADKDTFAKEMQQIYEESQTYHDGKWLMFEPKDQALFDDFMKLLRIKESPTKSNLFPQMMKMDMEKSRNTIFFLRKTMFRQKKSRIVAKVLATIPILVL
ncbi:MAG: DUF3788 family protein [Anaerotignum sp.]